MKIKLTFIVLLVAVFASAQNTNYGFNHSAGKYLNVGDAKIYYEVYGQGKPILLLHGGLYGSIGEFKNMIPVLSKNHKVIAINTRGHGKSEIGSKEMSYKLFAEDAVAVLKNESNERASVIGFSDGGITAYILAAEYAKYVNKIVALGGGINRSGYRGSGSKWVEELTPKSLENSDPDFVKARKKQMPNPEKWNEFIEKLKATWLEEVWVSDEKAKNIKCPVLTIGGDRDGFITSQHFVEVQAAIPNSQLAIIPNCGHVGVMTKSLVFDEFIIPFLETNK